MRHAILIALIMLAGCGKEEPPTTTVTENPAIHGGQWDVTITEPDFVVEKNPSPAFLRDVYQIAPRLADLESLYGPMTIDPSPEYAARNGKDRLWYIYEKTHKCSGFGASLPEAVENALVQCPKYLQMQAEKLDRASREGSVSDYKRLLQEQLGQPYPK